MFVLDLSVLIPVWLFSVPIAGFITKTFEQHERDGDGIPASLRVAMIVSWVWVVSLTVMIAVLLIKKSVSDPVVRAVVLTTALLMLLITVGGLFAKLRRRRIRDERAYLDSSDDRWSS